MTGRTGKGKGFEGKGKGVEQQIHRNEGDFHGLVHHQQRKGLEQHQLSHKDKRIGLVQHQNRCEDMRQTGSDPAFHEFSSIFSSTPFVQPARDHDFGQIFSSTPVVQPIDSTFPFQRCPFRDINSKRLLSTTDKSIFKGKAIVQPAKPFFLNPRFHDRRSQLTSKPGISPYFEKGESSHLHQQLQPPNSFGRENLFHKNPSTVHSFQRRNASDSLVPAKPHMRFKSNFTQRSQKRKMFKKQPVFDICEGAPFDSPVQLQSDQMQKDLDRQKLDSTIDRAPFIPKKIWRKKVQGKVDQGPQNPAHGPQLHDTSQEKLQNNVDQNQDPLNPSQQQLHVTFSNQMLQSSISTLQQRALLGSSSSSDDCLTGTESPNRLGEQEQELNSSMDEWWEDDTWRHSTNGEDSVGSLDMRELGRALLEAGYMAAHPSESQDEGNHLLDGEISHNEAETLESIVIKAHSLLRHMVTFTGTLPPKIPALEILENAEDCEHGRIFHHAAHKIIEHPVRQARKEFMSEDTDTGRTPPNHSYQQLTHGSPPIIMNVSRQVLTHVRVRQDFSTVDRDIQKIVDSHGFKTTMLPQAAFPSSLHGSLINPQHKLGTGLETEHGFSSKYRHVDVDLEP
ncbi:hypothetical protein SUGI_0364920 [Cryptomeria japonica]|nr:hypothetical protein SUGI_0364920 [Cryptomeria japonica]